MWSDIPASSTPQPTKTVQATPTAQFPGTPLPGESTLITTADGLQYFDLVQGTGAVAQKGETVTIQDVEWIAATRVEVDSSFTDGKPAEFPLGAGEVIKGLDEGIVGMRVGGWRKLIVPAALAYGSQGLPDGGIPPNATLVLDIELVAIK